LLRDAFIHLVTWFRVGVLTMPILNCRCVVGLASIALLTSLLDRNTTAQLVYQQEMKEYSAILPLTLDNTVYRVRAKPPEGVAPSDIICDIGITGTVLTDQRGTSASGSAEKVVGGLFSRDDIDVQFADRVFTGNRTYSGNRIVGKYDFDCGINIKYKNKLKVAQVEIRLGYVLPSGDIEGLTWAKISRKQRLLRRNIDKCSVYRDDIATLESERGALISGGANNDVQRTLIKSRLSGIDRQIRTRRRYVSQEEGFRRDLAAFASLNEYLKTKIHGSQVYVHFHHDGETLPVDVEDLKRSRVRPIQVFEYGKDPILARENS
jgi:hypothetical protein